MKKSVKILLIVFCVIVIAAVVIFCINGNDTGIVDGDASSDSVQVDDSYVFSEDVSKIKIEWVSGSVVVSKGEDDHIVVREKGVNIPLSNKLFCDVKNGELEIRFTKKTTGVYGITSQAFQKTLYVTVPEKIFDKLDVESVSADVKISGINCTDLEAESVSGYINIESVVTKGADIENVSGNCEISAIRTDRIAIASVSGDIVTDADIGVDGEFESTSGNITLLLPSDSSFTAKVSDVSGDFNSDFPVTKNGNTYIYSDGATKLSFDCVSGNINIKQK